MNDLESVALAALLRGLERFRQRTVQKAEIENPFAPLVDQEAGPLIEEAERLAARDLDQAADLDGRQSDQPAPWLEVVTQRIAIPRREKTRDLSIQEQRYYPLQPLNLFDALKDRNREDIRQRTIFPVIAGEVEKRSAPGGYEGLWKMFLREAARLPRGSLSAYLDSLLHLMRKYAWCVPAGESGNLARISLYDHSRVTAAIAVCLQAVRQQLTPAAPGEPEFLLIGGGLSGIQQFIYHPAFNGQELQDGLATRLRGRSFYLNLVVKTVADYLNEKLGLCGLNTLWTAGGHFLLIAPNTQSARDGLIAATQVIRQWLWLEHHGALGIVIADLALDRDGLQDFGAACEWLDKARARMRLQQLNLPLSIDEGLQNEAWESPWVLRMGTSVCRDTGRDLFEREQQISDEAQADEGGAAPPPRSSQSLLFDAIGRALIGARTIQLRRSGEWPEMEQAAGRQPRDVSDAGRLRGDIKDLLIEFPSFNRCWLLSAATEPRRAADLSLRIADHTNERIDFLSGDAQSSVAQGFEFMATAVKTRVEQDRDGRTHQAITDFRELAEQAEGAKYLGALRMDVDDLGYIFARCLPAEERSIAKTANLSQMLDWFFAGYLNVVVIGQDLSTTYASGDDLFIVGAWSQALDLADEIQQRFKKFCGHNPDLHLSAAMTLCHGQYPIGRAAEEAAERLDQIAKTVRRREIPGDSNKDALAFLERKISWRKWREVRSLGDRMIAAWDNHSLSRSFVHNLSELYHDHIDPQRDPSSEFAGEDLIWLPRFKFSLVRNVKDARLRADLVEAIERNKHYLSILAGYVLLKTRDRKKKNEQVMVNRRS